MSAKADYDKLARVRLQYLNRARHNALLTLPSLMPLEGDVTRSHLYEPYQGMGSACVVHLSSRMTVGFIPSGRPYMRMDLPPQEVLKAGAEVPPEAQAGLAKSEQLLQSEVEAANWRKSTMMTMQQLIVAGNCVEYIQPDNTIKTIRLDQYVHQLTSDGKLVKLIIRECFKRDEAPEGVTPPAQGSEDEELELFTVLERIAMGYRRSYEWADGSSAGKSITWTNEEFPYRPLGWAWQPHEDYARSKVEEHIADLRSLDALEKAGLEMAAMASRNFIMVRPGANGSSIKRQLVKALNGDVVVGDPDAVELKAFDNAKAYQLVQAQIATLREQLARAFLLASGAQRDAERVTAVEIERDIAELEAALGGVFSTLALDMMEWRTRVLMRQMIKQGKFPPVNEGALQPTILTGLEALSRERDVSRAMQAAQIIQAFGQEGLDAVKTERIIGRAMIGLGFPDTVRTEQEVQQLQQKRQQAQMVQEIASKAAPGVATEAMKQSGGNNG